MADLTIGTDLVPTDSAQIDSIIPILRITSKTLVPGTDRSVTADPTAGDIVFTLPDAASNAGVVFFIKRVENGGNLVRINAGGSDSIEHRAAGYILSLENEFITVYSDGTTAWRMGPRDLLSIATISVTGGSWTGTTSFTKFDSWDAALFSTPAKLVGSVANDNIAILEFQGPIQDGYTINMTFNCEYTNNSTITVQAYANGSLIGIPFSVNALGNGKPITLTIFENVGVSALTDLELHIKLENAGTLTDINAKMQIQRLGR